LTGLARGWSSSGVLSLIGKGALLSPIGVYVFFILLNRPSRRVIQHEGEALLILLKRLRARVVIERTVSVLGVLIVAIRLLKRKA
jgi:hypothetical protein